MANQSNPTDVDIPSNSGTAAEDEHGWGDRVVFFVSHCAAWLFPILVIAIVSQVILRGIGHNQAWLDDLHWWLYGAALMTGFAYAITNDSHVRVDIFYDNFTPRKQTLINIFGLGWLLMPFILIMTDIMFHYAASSLAAREGSDSPNGLHGLYLLKMLLVALFFLALIAAWAALQRNLRRITEPAFAKMILCAFPAVWFLGERVAYYSFWWYVRLSQPDLQPRRIAREDIFDYTNWTGLALLIALLTVAFLWSRLKSNSKEI